MLAQLNILLKFFNLALLHRVFQFHLSILSLQLLNQEAFQVVGLLGDGGLATRVQEVDLLLQGAGQVFNLFFLLLKIDVHLLGLSAKSRIFIPRDVILNL